MIHTVELSKYQGKPLNLGGVIKLIIDDLFDVDNVPEVTFILQINNNIMYGNYIIPTALGFSTPMHILGNLKKSLLIINTNTSTYTNTITNTSTYTNTITNTITNNNDSFKQFLIWGKTYNTKLYKVKPLVFEYSSDKYECGICLEQYKIGDKICKLQLCGHQFHKSCLSNLGSRITCPMCRNHAVLHQLNGLDHNERLNIYVNEMGL